MRRIFWAFLGLGAGIAGAVLTSRWARRQAQKVAPANLARRAGGGVLELGRRVSESIAEGKRAMDEKERELRGEPPVD